MNLSAMYTWIAARMGIQRTERGAALVEYILLVTLIAIVVLVAVQFLGTETSTKYDGTTSELFSS